MKFWDVVREVSTSAIRSEAEKIFVLALAGNREYVVAAREQILGPVAALPEPGGVGEFLYCAVPPYDEEAEKRLRHADLIVSLPGGPLLTDLRPADTILVPRVADVMKEVLRHRSDLRVALARRLPGFRATAAEMVIRDVSLANAEFALLSGVGQSLPFLSPLFPAVVGADVLVLTKNQIMMMFRLAALHGEDLDPVARLREVVPVIAGAFGWRTIARELAGFLPGGVGVPIRAGIAYSGTYATGRAAHVVFERGLGPTPAELRAIMREASVHAKEAVARLRDRVGRRETPGTVVVEEPQHALPAGQVEDSALPEGANLTPGPSEETPSSGS